MAVAITQHFTVTTVTLGASDVATKIIPPEYTKYLWIQFLENAGKLAYEGTDGGPIGADVLTFNADQVSEIQHPGDKPLYVASAIPGTILSIVAVERQ